MQDDFELLRLMMDDQKGQPDVYRPGPYWAKYQRRTADAIERHGLSKFRTRADIGKGYSDTVTMNPSELWHNPNAFRSKAKLALMRAPLIRTLFAEYRALVAHHHAVGREYADLYYQHRFGDWFASTSRHHDIPDGLHGGCQSYVTLNDAVVAQQYVDFVMRIHNFGRHLSFEKVRAVFEIGGGYGAWPHLILSMFPNIRKVVYLDIPPMIYVGTQYLKHFFGDAVINYRQTRGADKISFRDDDSREILCLCPWQIESLDVSVDLFWNTASLSEMTQEIADNYASHVVRCLNEDEAHICLIMNKVDAESNPDVVLPGGVTDAFGPNFNFEAIDVEVEHPSHLPYRLGRRK